MTKLFHRNFGSAGGNGEFALRKANVEVLMPRASLLEPSPRYSDAVSHREQFRRGIGNHVTHHHSPVASPHVVNVNHLATNLLFGTFPHELIQREMSSTVNTERAAIKFRIAGVGFRQRKPHCGRRAAGFVSIASPNGSHKSLTSLFGAENDVTLLHTGGQKFPMVIRDRGTVGEHTGCAVYRGKGRDPEFFLLAMDFSLDAGRMVQQQLSEITRLIRRENDVLVLDAAIAQFFGVTAISAVHFVLFAFLLVRRNIDDDLVLLIAPDLQKAFDLVSHVSPVLSSACAASVVSTSGGSSELHRRSAQGLWAVSCRQPRIGQALPADRFDHAVEALKAVPFDVAFVQSEREFVDISGEMFRTDLVIDAIDAAFQDRPDAFNRVRVSSASRVLASRMIHGVMPEEQTVQSGEDQVIVGVQLRSKFDVLVDTLGRFLQGALCHRSGDSASAALPHSEDGNLADWPASGSQFLVLMLVGFFATDEALVQFHDALEFRQFWPTARFAEPMQHEPC